jgi:hypothetical protein
VNAAAEAPDATNCVGTRLLGYATQDDGLTANACQVTEMLSGLNPAQVTMPELVRAVVHSAALRVRVKETP